MKTEIVKQVRLTPNQRYALMEAASNGGRLKSGDWGVKTTLGHLRLIEKRIAGSPAERAALEKKIADAWKAIPALVKAKKLSEVESALHSIRNAKYSLQQEAWYLTKAADEYLTKGRVVIEDVGKPAKES